VLVQIVFSHYSCFIEIVFQSISTTYVRDIQRFVIPFVKTFSGENLFQIYLLESARKDLALSFVVFKHILTNVSCLLLKLSTS